VNGRARPRAPAVGSVRAARVLVASLLPCWVWVAGGLGASGCEGGGRGVEPAPVAVSAAPAGTSADAARAALAALDAPATDGATREVVLEDATGHALDGLRRALARAARGEGRARLVFYGGSHTASDLYTGVVRSSLQGAFGDGGHGFVLPVPPISRYWQQGARVAEADGWASLEPSLKRMGVEAYGLGGMAFEATEPAWAEVATDGSRATRIEIMYLRQPGGGSLEIEIDGTARRVETEAGVLEAATATFEVPDAEHRVSLRTFDARPVRIFGVVFERGEGGVVVDQLGIAGSKARHQLLWDEAVWAPLFRSRAPDLLAFSYGNNELDDHHLPLAAYETHFTAMVARAQRHAPAASCLVIGPSDRQYPGPSGWKTPSLLAVLVDMQRRVARARGCAFFDVLAWQGGAGAVDRWLATRPPLERDDHVHFTPPAYRRLGEVLTRRLLAGMAD